MIRSKMLMGLIVSLLFLVGCKDQDQDHDLEINSNNIPQVRFELYYYGLETTANDINSRIYSAVEDLIDDYKGITFHITITGEDWKGNYLETKLDPYTINKSDMKEIASYSSSNYKFFGTEGEWILRQNGYYR